MQVEFVQLCSSIKEVASYTHLYRTQAKRIDKMASTAIFIQSEINKFNCHGFSLSNDVNRFCAAAVLKKSLFV